eukprot:5722843-Alexandrium_andersonii.AAC.1
MLLVVLEEGGEGVHTCQAMRGEVPQHRTTGAEGGGALDPLKERALDPDMHDEVLPRTDAVSGTSV